MTDLAVVLGVAAVTGTTMRALRQPPILGYLLAGLVVGPYIPIPLFAEVDRVHELSELGVVLVMFAVGLEFSLARAARVLPVAGLIAAVQISGMFWAGNLVGAALGLSSAGAVVLGGSVAISSTMVVTKVFELQPPPDDIRETVLGVLVLQDLAAIVLITVVTAVAAGSSVAPSVMLVTIGKLLLVMAVAVALGLLVVPRMVRVVARLKSAEVDTVFAVGVCFALAAALEHLDYSPALGAFLGGMLVAESGLGRRFEHLVAPLRDVFAAIFFVSVGMAVDPFVAVDHLGAAALVAVAVVVLQAGLVTGAGLLSGRGLRQAGQAGAALGQVGEFGFIIVGIGVAAEIVPGWLYTVVVIVAVLTAFTTPLVLARAPALLGLVEHRLPHRLRTNLSLYAAWVDSLRRGRTASPLRRTLRRAILISLLDVGVVAGIVIAASLGWDVALERLVDVGVPPAAAVGAVIITAGLAAYPFARSMSRASTSIGLLLAKAALPPGEDSRPDLTITARRSMSVAVRLGSLLAAGVLVAALTQPFVTPGIGLALLAAALVPSATTLWRTAKPLGDDVESATLTLVGLLRASPPAEQTPEVGELLHGLGDATPVRLDEGAAAIGKTLAEVDLRAKTGATAIAVAHPERDVVIPTGREGLIEGDTLTIAGPRHAIERARVLLLGGPEAKGSAPGPEGVADSPDVTPPGSPRGGAGDPP